MVAVRDVRTPTQLELEDEMRKREESRKHMIKMDAELARLKARRGELEAQIEGAEAVIEREKRLDEEHWDRVDLLRKRVEEEKETRDRENRERREKLDQQKKLKELVAARATIEMAELSGQIGQVPRRPASDYSLIGGPGYVPAMAASPTPQQSSVYLPQSPTVQPGAYQPSLFTGEVSGAKGAQGGMSGGRPTQSSSSVKPRLDVNSSPSNRSVRVSHTPKRKGRSGDDEEEYRRETIRRSRRDEEEEVSKVTKRRRGSRDDSEDDDDRR